MRELTSFDTESAEVRHHEQSVKTADIYEKMLMDAGYAESDECFNSLSQIADEILQDEEGQNMARVDGIQFALSHTESMRERFDSFEVGEVVIVESAISSSAIRDESGHSDASTKGRAVYNGKGKLPKGLRSGVVVSKTDNILTVEYMPTPTAYSGLYNQPESWRESFSWRDLGAVQKVVRS